MIEDQDDLSWYGRKADSLREKTAATPTADPAREERINALLSELSRAGILGSIAGRTLFTRGIAPGCKGCLAGEGTNLYTTGLCTRDCFFCFNTKPRRDEIVVHGIKVAEPEMARDIVARYDLRSVGISGGEPLLFPERVVRIIRALRELPRRVRIDLYTNGDRATDEVLGRLKHAGLDALRFNLVAREFDTTPVERALRYFSEVAVEVPVVPSLMTELKEMVLRLDKLGVPFLNIHELFSCAENRDRVADEEGATEGAASDVLLWKPVVEGDEAALTLLLFALKNTKRLSTYYCSCRTQELISQRGFARRKRLLEDAP